ncbi:MAG: hypothetical protein HFH41_01455 [Lachnospiraceae bacterium]|nr:hypothetical protein [Lachnospiraceae bacterium]
MSRKDQKRETGFLFEPEQITEVFKKIRQQNGLIHMIPNTVSASLCAHGLAALGARPLMAVAPEEMAEILEQADACVINLGQLNQEKLSAANLALQWGKDLQKPIVLDPVGCGASTFRMQAAEKLLKLSWRGIIKGNQSELYSIQQKELTKEGIDSRKNRCLSDKIQPGRVYLATGREDCVLWEGQKLEMPHRKKIVHNILGTGCLLGAVTGACYCAAAEKSEREGALPKEAEETGTDHMVLAAAAASRGMEYALEQAGKQSGYGGAVTALLDGLEELSEKKFLDWLKGDLK